MTIRRPVISLLTDFGHMDPFVGMMKGVMLGINPDISIVDVTHEIPPQDISAGAHHLANAWRHFPGGTVHVAVVDPGVGSRRRALAVSAEGHYFVAPDNGLLTRVLHGASAWSAHAITESHYMAPAPSETFHGRDVFAPAAAHLSRGTFLENFGPEVIDPVLAPEEFPRIDGPTIRARVVHVDRFGNLVLNVDRGLLTGAAGGVEGGQSATTPPAALEDSGSSEGPAAFAGLKISTEVGGRRIDRFVGHYAEAEGAPCFLINSDDTLEIAIPGRSASAHLGLTRGSEVVLQLAR